MAPKANPCVICGKTTRVTHMGLDICRACTVFYKRNVSRESQLICVVGTLDCVDFQKGNYTCRKCRMDRINDLIRASNRGNTALVPSCSSSPPNLMSPDIPPLLNEPSLIDRMRGYYQRLSTIRRNNELALRGVYIDSISASREEYDIAPCTYQLMNQSVRIMISSLFDFAASAFPEFMEMSLSDKWLLIRNFQTTFHCLESHIRGQRRFPNEKGKCFGTYTTYLSSESSGLYFSDCVKRQHVAEAVRTLQHCIRENCYNIRDHVDRVRPNDEEFMAMLVIAFWSIDDCETHESFLELSARYRTEALRRLMNNYKDTIGAMEGTIRIGELYGLLGALKKVEMNMKWEYEVYRMLDLFDDNTYMYNLQMHKSDSICSNPHYLDERFNRFV